MNGKVIFSILVILGTTEASPQRSASSQGARLGAIPFPGQNGNNEELKYTQSDNNFELKCENERGICKGHCNTLGYLAGGCIDDACHCYSGFECDGIVPIGDIAMSEKHNSCKIHCQLLRKEFGGGECIEGKCHCKEQPRLILA